MSNNIEKPRIYTIDSFYYYFVWDNCTDLSKQYEVLIFALDKDSELQCCNQNNPLIVTYNTPISAFDFEKVCDKELFSIPLNSEFCKFQIREAGTTDWSNQFPNDDYFVSLTPVCSNCVKQDMNNLLNYISIDIGPDLKNYVNNNTSVGQGVEKYKLLFYNKDALNEQKKFIIADEDSITQNNNHLTFAMYYNSNIDPRTQYTIIPLFSRSVSGISSKFNEKYFQQFEDKIVPREEYTLEKGKQTVITTPNKKGALIYIQEGEGWKIGSTSLIAGQTYSFLDIELLTFNGQSATSDLKCIIHGQEINSIIDYKRGVQFKSDFYKEQEEALKDLDSLQVIEAVNGEYENGFRYQYNQDIHHTPLFIYQLYSDTNMYKLTNDVYNDRQNVLTEGEIIFDQIDNATDNLVVTTAPVLSSIGNLKTISITKEDIVNVTKECKKELSVSQIFNSIDEFFRWDLNTSTAFKIQEKGNDLFLYVRGLKEKKTDLYSYKVIIQNQISDREIFKEEIDLTYRGSGVWMLSKNEIDYDINNPFPLKRLQTNELSSKTIYHCYIKRYFNNNEFLMEEKDIASNTQKFFIAPITLQDKNGDTFIYETERNDMSNLTQGYPWILHNNYIDKYEDDTNIICYSNKANNYIEDSSFNNVTALYREDELVYYNNSNNTTHIDYKSGYYSNNWIKFDLGKNKNLDTFSGLFLSRPSEVLYSPSCDIQIWDGVTVLDEQRSVILNNISYNILYSDFIDMLLLDFTQIKQINNFTKNLNTNNNVKSLNILGFYDKDGEYERIKIWTVDNVIDRLYTEINLKKYKYFKFELIFNDNIDSQATAIIEYKVLKQQWETQQHITVPYYGSQEIQLSNIQCRYFRLKGNILGKIEGDISLLTYSGTGGLLAYDKDYSDNLQKINIDYYPPLVFTNKNIIPMLDFEITELGRHNIINSNNKTVFSNINNAEVIHNDYDASNHTMQIEVQGNSTGKNPRCFMRIADEIDENCIESNYIDFKNTVFTCFKDLTIRNYINRQVLYQTPNDIDLTEEYTITGEDILNNLNTPYHSDNKIGLQFLLSNDGYIKTDNLQIMRLYKPSDDSDLLTRRKFYVDNFIINKIKEKSITETININTYTENINVANYDIIYISSNNIKSTQTLWFTYDDNENPIRINLNLEEETQIDISQYSTIKFMGMGHDMTSYFISYQLASNAISTSELDYTQIKNGSIISGQVIDSHQPIKLYIKKFDNLLNHNDDIFYKITKIKEDYEIIKDKIDDDNYSLIISQKDFNDNIFDKNFFINSHTKQLQIKNSNITKIKFNNTQKDTIVNCILEKE